MATVVFYFQVHQPFRLKRYSVFHNDPFYFDDAKNAEICRKVANKCYLPATRLILDLVRKHKGNFRVSYAITGVVLDQLEAFCPEVIDVFKELGATGCCEFIGETYHHSLSFLYSPEEFREQIAMHTAKIERLFGQTPVVFRNTELIYNNRLAHDLCQIKDASGNPRFYGALCEGTDWHLGYRTPNFVYKPPGWDAFNTGDRRDLIGRDGKLFKLLLKNYRLSDDVAFRFSNRAWEEWPLTAEKFARWVDQINGNGYLCNLFMDYETFGEHQWADTGVFEFLSKLPEAVFDVKPGHNHFSTVGEAMRRFEPAGEYDVHDPISWADTERDLTAWRGNAMQHNALEETYRLERPIKDKLAHAAEAYRKAHGGSEPPADLPDHHPVSQARHLLADWRKLTTSDHFYYMCTKYFADGDVHKYFNPYDSPYDSYINFMNVLDNVRSRLSSEGHRPAP
ncbi:MAG: polysaccharide deacetylase family protein [Phycisphaeraceae bacterium]|nr:MAG: polysaccharide deacetylase family protein [Phycisphaeraceae bacterium]